MRQFSASSGCNCDFSSERSKRVVNQIADAHGIGIGGVTRIELQRIAFDADDQIARRMIRGRVNGRRQRATA